MRPIDVEPHRQVEQLFEIGPGREFHGVGGVGGELADRDGLEQQRARLIVTLPSLYATSLRRLFDIQEAMAARLHAAFPDELDRLPAAILVGAFAGAGMAALRTAADADTPLEPAVRAAIHEVHERFR